MKKVVLLFMTILSFYTLTGFTTKSGWTLPDECEMMQQNGNRYKFSIGAGPCEYEDNDSDVIIVGDSRACYMMRDTNESSVSWCTKPGCGLTWVANEGIPSIAASLPGKTVVFLVGINDISPLRNGHERAQMLRWYKEYYTSFVQNNPTTTVYVSAITMRGNLALPEYAKFNRAIQAFNYELSKLPGIRFIDTFQYLLDTGYGYLSYEDTLHYDAITNANTLSYILSVVRGKPADIAPVQPAVDPEPEKAEEAEASVPEVAAVNSEAVVSVPMQSTANSEEPVVNS